MAQRAHVDAIWLHIPRRYRRFPDWDGVLPDVPPGIEIRRPDEDFGPATKVLPAAYDLAGQDADILFCDDDRLYRPDWAETFLAERKTAPARTAIASMGFEADLLIPDISPRSFAPRAVKRPWHRDLSFLARSAVFEVRNRLPNAPDRPRRRVFKRSGYIDIFMGFGGVMVRPDHFDADDGNIPEACWTVDDVWLSGMLARKGIPIWIAANMVEPKNTDGYLLEALFSAEIEGVRRPEAEAICSRYMQEHHGLWLSQ